jgi:PAS domain-containing protein
MKIACSYCRKDMGEKEPLESSDTTHSICDACRAYYEQQWEGMTWRDYLEGIDRPAVILDRETRLRACNAAAEKMLGRKCEDIRGLLGGEFMECRWARLPEGCGETVHCAACAIRRTVTDTLATGQAHENVPAILSRLAPSGPTDVKLSVSTSLTADGLVRIVVEHDK